MPRSYPRSRHLRRFVSHPCFVLALASLCLAYHAHSALANPILHCEDGSVLLGRFYGGHAERIFDPYAGYRSILPQSLGYLASRVEPRAIPTVFVWTAFSVSLATLAVVYRCMPTRRAAALACLAIACAPIANFALVTSITYSISHLLLCLLLVTAAVTPTSILLSSVVLILSVGCATSHPLAIVAVPVALRRLWLDTRELYGRVFFGALASICLFGPLWATKSGASGGLDLARATSRLAPYVSERVVVEALVGPDARLWIREHIGPWLFHAIALMAFLWIAHVCWSRRRALEPRTRRFVENLALMAILVTVAALGVNAREVGPGDLYGQRYCYVQRCLFFCIVAVLLPRTALAHATFVVAATILLPLWLTSGKWLYEVSPAEARRIDRFMIAIEEFEGERLHTTKPLRLDREDWPIVVEKRR